MTCDPVLCVTGGDSLAARTYQGLLVVARGLQRGVAASPRVPEGVQGVQVWGALWGGHRGGRRAHDDGRGHGPPALQVPVGGDSQGVHLHLCTGGDRGHHVRGRCSWEPPGALPNGVVGSKIPPHRVERQRVNVTTS